MSLFRRKMEGTVRTGEAVLTSEQQTQIQLRDALIDVLDEIEESGLEVDEEEIKTRVFSICDSFGIAIGNITEHLNSIATKKPKPHSCTQCGAPLKDGKCDYCGTNYN